MISPSAQQEVQGSGSQSGGGQGGGSPGEQGAGGVRKTGEERTGSGISMMAGSGREIPKGKLSFICYCSSSSQRNEPNNVS